MQLSAPCRLIRCLAELAGEQPIRVRLPIHTLLPLLCACSHEGRTLPSH